MAYLYTYMYHKNQPKIDDGSYGYVNSLFSCLSLSKRNFKKQITLPETNMAPENGWLED